MQLHSDEEFDAAILVMIRGDELHIQTTDNLSPMQFMEILLAISLNLQGVLDEADDLINRTIQ
jgi:hypothetical protein